MTTALPPRVSRWMNLAESLGLEVDQGQELTTGIVTVTVFAHDSLNTEMWFHVALRSGSVTVQRWTAVHGQPSVVRQRDVHYYLREMGGDA